MVGVGAIVATNYDAAIARVMTGESPNGDRFWSKEMLINVLVQL